MISFFSKRTRKDQLLITILIIFHAIGLFVMHAMEDGARLSYLNLLVCAIVLLIAEGIEIKNLLVLAGIAVAGIGIEWIGVHTGVLFGNYRYGDALGWKIDSIPLIIGLNWYAIVVASSSMVDQLHSSIALKSLMAGLLATLLDLLIEPVAIELDYWSWNGGTIPVFNYLCWFGFSALFAAFYLQLKTQQNFPAKSLFIIWALFFIVLNFTLT